MKNRAGRPPGVPARARFAERLLTYVGILGGDACWPWLGAYAGGGAPQIRVTGMPTTSARIFVWAAFRKGPVPKRACAACKYGNPSCCRPDHLVLRRLGRQKGYWVARPQSPSSP